jgi:hypothetical protein
MPLASAERLNWLDDSPDYPRRSAHPAGCGECDKLHHCLPRSVIVILLDHPHWVLWWVKLAIVGCLVPV